LPHLSPSTSQIQKFPEFQGTGSGSEIFFPYQDFYLLQVLPLHKPVEGITALIIAFPSARRASSVVASIQILSTTGTGDFRDDVGNLI